MAYKVERDGESWTCDTFAREDGTINLYDRAAGVGADPINDEPFDSEEEAAGWLRDEGWTVTPE